MFWCRTGSGSKFPFDADPDPEQEPDWHQNDADPNADPTQSFTYVGKWGKNFYFIRSLLSFSYLIKIKCVMNLSILDKFHKKIHVLQMELNDTDPD